MVNTPSKGQDPAQVDMREGLFSYANANRFTPPPVLVAISQLLIKNKTIAKVLGVTPNYVTMMLAGRLECSTKHDAKLKLLLHNSIVIGKKTCDEAESGSFKWGRKVFPPSAIEFMRKRIAEAEEVLADLEKGN